MHLYCDAQILFGYVNWKWHNKDLIKIIIIIIIKRCDVRLEIDDIFI